MVGYFGHLAAFLFLFIFVILPSTLTASKDVKPSVGAILDYTLLVGKEEKVAMEMAVADSNAASHHQGITLHILDSGGDPIRAAASAKKLISKHQARVILGFNRWEETLSVAEVANKYQVPLLSLANDIPLWAPQQWPFLVSVARSQHSQMKAIAAIVQSWKWRKVTLIYEETLNPIIPHLITSLHKVNSDIDDFVILPPFSPYPLSEKLFNLKKKQCRVFIVHASSEVAANLFLEAKEMGMMEEEYVWITTDTITSRVDSLNASVISAMQGVLGVKSYYPHTQIEYKEFSSRFMAIFRTHYPQDPYIEPGTNALQAYDAVRAVAVTLVARLNTENSTINNPGWNFLGNINQISFKGLAGKFDLAGGKLAPSDLFRIINVVGKSYREIGYWSDRSGFSASIGEGSNYSHLMKILGQIYWPGGAWFVPKGWDVHTNGNQLKLGVPAYTTFSDFVWWRHNNSGGDPIAEGFSIDVFRAVVELLRDNLNYNLNYRLIQFNGTYNSLVQQIELKVFDGAIGDIAIVANRCKYGEFSQPYTESGIQMVAYARPKTKRQWLFTKPFTTGMWVATFVINLYNGFVVWFIERNNNQDFRSNNRFGTTVWLAFTTLFTSLQGDKLHTNVAKMVVVVWLFVALVITSTFTASLTSFLTLQNLNPKVADVETLKRNNAKVGCDGNSFVPKYLENVLGFHPNNIKNYTSGDAYPQALMSGEIDAAFLEVPYVKVLLAKYCNIFTTGSETFKVGGFGFVFARGAPFLPDISAAVLNVSESGTLLHLERSMLSSYNCSSSDETEYVHDSVGLDSFSVLFAITALTSTLALLITKFWETEEQRALPKGPQQQAVPMYPLGNVG